MRQSNDESHHLHCMHWRPAARIAFGHRCQLISEIRLPTVLSVAPDLDVERLRLLTVLAASILRVSITQNVAASGVAYP
jgi:hypothetical protein